MNRLIPTLSIGRVVRYVLSAGDCIDISEIRRDCIDPAVGNTPQPGDIIPAIVVRPFSDTLFNGQGILDGNHSIWLASVALDQDGKTPGTWHWPEFSAPAPAPGEDWTTGESVPEPSSEAGTGAPSQSKGALKRPEAAPAYYGEPFGGHPARD